MRPARDDQERYSAARLSARLQTLIGAARGVADLDGLHREAAGVLGAGHETTLLIEHTLELRRDAGRTVAESLPVWAGLGERAARALPPESAAAIAIRTRYRRRLRACGRPADLDAVVELCRGECGAGFGDARADLALVLRDRAWFAGERDGLAEAIAMIDAEVCRRGDGTRPDQVAARLIQVEVLLAIGRADQGAAGRALELAEGLVRREEFEDDDELPRAHVLLAEALLLTGRTMEAGRVARLAYALHTGVFDPARSLLTLARAEGDAAQARAALRQRQGAFPADSYYVTEARELVEELSR